MTGCNHVIGYKIVDYDGTNDGEVYIYSESALDIYMARAFSTGCQNDVERYYKFDYCLACGQKISWDNIIQRLEYEYAKEIGLTE